MMTEAQSFLRDNDISRKSFIHERTLQNCKEIFMYYNCRTYIYIYNEYKYIIETSQSI